MGEKKIPTNRSPEAQSTAAVCCNGEIDISMLICIYVWKVYAMALIIIIFVHKLYEEKSEAVHCLHDECETQEEKQDSSEIKQDVLGQKQHQHFKGKNRYCKCHCKRRRIDNVKCYLTVGMLASQIHALIQLFLKACSIKHVRYKHVLGNDILKPIEPNVFKWMVFYPFNALDYYIILFMITNAGIGHNCCTRIYPNFDLNLKIDNTTITEKEIEKKVNINVQLNKNHLKKAMDDDQYIQVKSPLLTKRQSKIIQDILPPFEDMFKIETVHKSLSLKLEMNNCPTTVDQNLYELKDSLQRAWDIALHPAYTYFERDHDLSIAVYPVVNVSVHKLMRYEILRLRSYNRNSTMPIYSVAQLAQNGFYLSGQDGEVTCFNCEVQHKEFLSGLNLDETAHGDNCGRERMSKNYGLHIGTNGLSSADLTIFNTIYGDSSSSGKLFIQQQPLPTEESQVLFMYTSATNENPVKTKIESMYWRVLKEDEDFFANGANDDFLDLRAAAYPLFANQRTRKDTFVSWDPSHSQKPDVLVRLGFFYAGYSDCARCFYCGLGLKYWRPNDDAAYQHARFRPQCKYNQFVQGQAFIDHVQRTIAEENQGAAAAVDAIEVPNLEQLMRSEAVRQVLAEGWSRMEVQAEVVQLVKDLGEECLVYDILLEVLNLKGQPSGSNQAASRAGRDGHDGVPSGEDNALEKSAQSSHRDADNANLVLKSQSETVTMTNLVPESLDPDVVFRLLEREHNYLKKRLDCQVCRKNKIGCIYLPCGHVVACQKCGDMASTCVLCQRVISAMASIYLS